MFVNLAYSEFFWSSGAFEVVDCGGKGAGKEQKNCLSIGQFFIGIYYVGIIDAC